MTYLLKAVGADPEFFIRDGWGAHRPAIGLIGGTKDKPRFIAEDGFTAVQEDNVMVEFNIKPAVRAQDFRDNTLFVMNYLNNYLNDKGYLFSVVPSVEFEKKYLRHPQAQEIGCMGDYNAWTWRPNPRLDAKKLGTLRTAGGHVHISFEIAGKDGEMTDDARVKMVRACDLSLGVPSILLDGDDRRRKFYGRAGCFRPKDYGVEYRTLSNFWITSPQLMEWVFNQVVWTINKINAGGMELDIEHQEWIQRAINTSDKALSSDLVELFNVPMPPK